MLWYLTGASSEGSDTGKSLPLCATSISAFRSGEAANREQFVSGKITDYSGAIQAYLTHYSYSPVPTA